MAERSYTAADIKTLTRQSVEQWEYERAWSKFVEEYGHLIAERQSLYSRWSRTKHPERKADLWTAFVELREQPNALEEQLVPRDPDEEQE
jgi:hypothetical protein